MSGWGRCCAIGNYSHHIFADCCAGTEMCCRQDGVPPGVGEGGSVHVVPIGSVRDFHFLLRVPHTRILSL